MDEELRNFLDTGEIHQLDVCERLIAIIWWHQKSGISPTNFDLIEAANEGAGYPQINKSREREKLRKSSKTASSDRGVSFRVRPSAMRDLDQKYREICQIRELPESNSLFDLNLFRETRGYINKVVLQINLSYDAGLYDCSAVMIRRLLETLIVETYEKIGRANELKGRDGNFQMFSGLINVIENDGSLNIGRQSMQGLKAFKHIADSSAHNRRFNASKKDIDDKIDGVRLAVTELRQIAFDS